MACENLLYEKRDGIGFITFNRPKVLNALNRKTMEELRDILSAARDDDEVRVLILTGAGEKSFVAGADIGELAVQTPVSGKDTAAFGQSVLRLLETIGKPSIAAINGFALGGGCEVALACSMRLASKTAKLGQPEVKLGILPGYGGSQRLTRLCGKGAAYEICLTGEMISAEEALRIGRVNHVYEPAELLPAAGAVDALETSGADAENITVVHVPGSFEIPLTAKKLAEGGRTDAVIAIGCVLRGETAHFDYVASEVARGVQLAQLDTGVPIIFCVLTCDTLEQAIDRAGLKGGNKGFEAGLAAIEMAHLSRKLAGGKSSSAAPSTTSSRKPRRR